MTPPPLRSHYVSKSKGIKLKKKDNNKTAETTIEEKRRLQAREHKENVQQTFRFYHRSSGLCFVEPMKHIDSFVRGHSYLSVTEVKSDIALIII